MSSSRGEFRDHTTPNKPTEYDEMDKVTLAALKSKDWNAWENRRQSNPPGPSLHVTGKVETLNGAIMPTLRPSVPQGINPSILMLDLALEDSGFGTDDIAFRSVHFTDVVSVGGYEEVQVLWEGETIETVDVVVIE